MGQARPSIGARGGLQGLLGSDTMTKPGWYADPHDPHVEIYWTGREWSARRPRGSHPGQPTEGVNVPPAPPRKRMSTAKVLAIAGACLLIPVGAIVVWVVVTLSKSDYERCVDLWTGSTLAEKSQTEAERFCRDMEEIENLGGRP